MSLLKHDMKAKFIKTVTKGEYVGEGETVRVLDRQAFKKYANEVHYKALSRNEAEKAAAAEKVLKVMSSFGGEAELKNIEADFHVLNILRDLPALDFVETRPLPLGELPIFRLKYKPYVNCTMGSLHGGLATGYYANKEYGFQVVPFTYGSESQMVPNLNNLYDMQKLAQRKDALERVDYSLKVIQNNICFNALLANSKSVSLVQDDPAVSLTNYFADGGSFAGKSVYVLDPGVPAAAVPSVNIYDLSATENGLTKRVFQVLNTHRLQLGVNIPKLYIPQQATSGKSPVWESLQNLATPVALVTGTVGSADPAKAVDKDMWQEFQRADFSGSVIMNWFGMTVEVQKANWMPAGYLLAITDQPGIICWERLELQSNDGFEGIFEQPVDAFYSTYNRMKNIAVVRPDPGLKAFVIVKVNA